MQNVDYRVVGTK